MKTRMRNKQSLKATAFLSIALFALAATAGTDLVEEVRAIAKQLDQMTIEKIIPDEVVEKSIDDMLHSLSSGKLLWHANTYARHEVFKTHLDAPFDDERQAFYARHAAYTASGWGNEDWYAENAGVPVETVFWLNHARKAIMWKARNHFKDPENLKAFVDAKMPIFEKAVGDLPANARRWFIYWLTHVENTIEDFSSLKVQDLYNTFKEGEKQYKEQYKKIDGDWQEESQAYERLEQARLNLSEATNNLYLTLFIGRRYNEGGEAVVHAWKEVASGLKNSVEKIAAE